MRKDLDQTFACRTIEIVEAEISDAALHFVVSWSRAKPGHN